MDDSIAHPSWKPGTLESPAWKTVLSTGSAILLALLMLVSGLWKSSDPVGAAVRLNQALVPAALSLPGALALGISETVAGVLLLVPRFRRWGAWLSGLLLIAFLLYIGINYNALRGEECNCFPWIKRAVGAGFFVGDVVMLVMALLAGMWARPSEGRRSALLVLAAVTVFALVSFGVSATRTSGAAAPETIQVDGKPFALREGRVLLYFYDPECSHCFFAARDMSGYDWKNVQVVAVPTERPEFARQFLNDSGLEAPISGDAVKLREVFKFGDPPFGVALDGGRVAATITVFEGAEPKATLERIGFVRAAASE